MSYNNPFVLNKHDYKRDINIQHHYVEDVAAFLAKMENITMEAARDFVTKAIGPGGKFEFKDRRVMYLERNKFGDREQKVGTLTKYLNQAIERHDLTAATLTTYLHPKVKKSMLVDFIDANVKARKAAKKEKFSAQQEGNWVLAEIKELEQTNRKLSNNSISGAHVSASTPLYNKTAHSTLTSLCRSTSAYGNANNEKFLAGNRHYWSEEVILANIISITRNTDYADLQATMQLYSMAIPSIEDTLECIDRGAKLYRIHVWACPNIVALVNTLQPLERAAFVYVGDLYHIRKHNDQLVRDFIGSIAEKQPACAPEEADKLMNEAFEDNLHLATVLNSPVAKGKKMDKIKKEDPEGYGMIAATAKHIGDVVNNYAHFIRTFFVTANVPASIAHLPDSIRHVALTSDTDSTIFTVQDWVEWMYGRIGFEEKDLNLSSTMIFLAAQTITHVLARMSANMGIETERIHTVAMKNEYRFDIFTPTQVAKHYYATKSVQEGVVKGEAEIEIKGVHLKSSKAPRAVVQMAADMMQGIMDTVMAGKKISIRAILKQIADLERSIATSITRGDPDYFSYAQIKAPESYTQGELRSNYIHYMLWRDVFEPKYGEVGKPPYLAIKVSTELEKPSVMKEWLEKLEDRELAERMVKWMGVVGRNSLGTIIFPEELIKANGIPKEIIPMINVRGLVAETSKIFYLILETLGIYYPDKRNARLAMDEH